MPAYVVALIEAVTDPATYATYVGQVEATLAPFGGRFIVRKPGPQILEGAFSPARAIILEFPSERHAQDWHASPGYEPVMRLRQSASRGSLLLLPAYAPAGQAPAIHDVCYVEHVTPDVEALVGIGEGTYGWSFAPPEEPLGSARIATLPGGGRVAVRAPMSATEKPITRAYVRVADIESAVKLAEKSGAMIALPPVTLGAHGTIAIWIAGGIEQGAWQLP